MAWIDRHDPPTQSDMARRLGMSAMYVYRILKNVVGTTQLKKRTVHELSESQMKQRHRRGNFFKNIYRDEN